jgi:hypothetical protein
VKTEVRKTNKENLKYRKRKKKINYNEAREYGEHEDETM